MVRWVLAIAAAVAACVCVAPVQASPPLEAYGAPLSLDLTEMSPSGDRYAIVVREADGPTLHVLNANREIEASMPLGDLKVRKIVWAGERQLILLASETVNTPMLARFKQEWLGAIHIDLQTLKQRVMLDSSVKIVRAIFGWYGVRQINGRWYAFIGGAPLADLQPSLTGHAVYPELHRVDLQTGRTTRVAGSSGQLTYWLVDPQGKVAARLDYDVYSKVYTLFSGEFDRTPLLELKADGGDEWLSLAGFGQTEDTVLVESVIDGVHAFREVPRAAEKPEAVLWKDMDAGVPLFDPSTGHLIGVRNGGAGPVQFLIPAYEKRLEAVQKALAGRSVALTSYASGLDRMIVQTDGPTDSGTQWLVDFAGKGVNPIGFTRPEIAASDLGAVRTFRYKAADGLELDGVLTLPSGASAVGLPLIVLPHGGPSAFADRPRFHWMAQAFASRGYAVFQPNYRGTLGYGETFRAAANGELGRKMQTDLSDGVAALSVDGLIDPERVCIVGASYGGYAALAGVSLQSGVYRCAVSVAGFADLRAFVATIDRWSSRDARGASFLKDLVGGARRQDMAAVSPITHADTVSAPVLMIHGLDDTVVPVAQSRAMERALRAAGKPVELLILNGEDHWMSKEETRVQMLSATVAFVEKHNPAR